MQKVLLNILKQKENTHTHPPPKNDNDDESIFAFDRRSFAPLFIVLSVSAHPLGYCRHLLFSPSRHPLNN